MCSEKRAKTPWDEFREIMQKQVDFLGETLPELEGELRQEALDAKQQLEATLAPNSTPNPNPNPDPDPDPNPDCRPH